MGHPRFFYDQPKPVSIGDKLLANAHSVKLELMRTGRGSMLVEVQVTSVLGNELLGNEDDLSDADIQKGNAEATAFCRSVLTSFAAACREGGDA